MRSFKSNENIHKKEGGSYYVVSANKASSVTLQSPGNESPLCIPTSAARYLMTKILTITANINQQSVLNLPVKAIAENIAQKKFCGKMNLS